MPRWSEPFLATSAERRQLTVMFCDLVDSTALAARLDPEDLRDVIAVYRHGVTETAKSFGGFVAKYMGDGVLVYFGYPQAHEDDAERAVRAGLALVDEVGRLQTSERLQVRIGIDTGLVVGDLVGTGEAQERTVVGETPNRAAPLQTLAAPGAVVIGPTTLRLLGDLFEYRDLGPVSLKGFATPICAWHVLRPSVVESRFAALHATALTPLVGRDRELAQIRERWQCAKQHRGQVVLVSGEPGIGKSRLIAAVQELLGCEPHYPLAYFCSPFHQDSALHPMIRHLEHAAGVERDEDPQAKFDSLAALLARTAATAEERTLLAELMALPTPEADAAALRFNPQQKKERTFAALLRQVETSARKQPVLMLFEDVHWIDPSSRELLGLIVERIADLPVLLVITFRPEFQPPWLGAEHVTLLTLNRLGSRPAEVLVTHLLGERASSLPDSLVGEIVDHTDGVPLFLEELTKAVLDTGAAHPRIAFAPGGPTGPPIPTTLQDSLMARLDRLGGAAKALAQVGAVLGRDFPTI